MEELTGVNSKWASTLMSQHLLAAADRYGLERLRLLCEASLCDNVAINTVATTLALAEQHHCFQLKAVCLKFVAMPENLRGGYPLIIFILVQLINVASDGSFMTFHSERKFFVFVDSRILTVFDMIWLEDFNFWSLFQRHA